MRQSASQSAWSSRGYLPHFDVAGQIQFLTFRLADSLPRKILQSRLDGLPITDIGARREAIEQEIDRGYGACWLGRPETAEVVESALMHFDGARYKLFAWVVMPNHLHWMMQSFPDFHLSSITKSIKSFTSRQCNLLLNRQGDFWARDYFDRGIRDQRQLNATIEYIHHNPVKAGLCQDPADWRFSSAWENRSIYPDV